MVTDHLGDIGVDDGIMYKWILKKQNTRLCNGFLWLRMGSSGRMMHVVMNFGLNRKEYVTVNFSTMIVLLGIGEVQVEHPTCVQGQADQ